MHTCWYWWDQLISKYLLKLSDILKTHYRHTEYVQEEVWCWKTIFVKTAALRWYSLDGACMMTSTWLEKFVEKFWYFADSLKTHWTCAWRSLRLEKNNFWQNDYHFNFAIYIYPYICLSVLVFPITYNLKQICILIHCFSVSTRQSLPCVVLIIDIS